MPWSGLSSFIWVFQFVFDLYRTQKLWALLVIELFLYLIFNVFLSHQTMVRAVAMYFSQPACCSYAAYYVINGVFIHISDNNVFRIVLLIRVSADRGPGCRHSFGVCRPVLHVIISSVYFSIYWITGFALYFDSWVSSPWSRLSSFIGSMYFAFIYPFRI